MQVLPSTAHNPQINIRDIRLPVNNVHAGVKYLAFSRDRYFSKKRHSRHEQINFALAAYNVGPAKL